jgi:hypothetical protein
VKLKLLVLFALLAGSALLFATPSRANYSNPVVIGGCNHSAAGTVSSDSCVTTGPVPVNSLLVVSLSGYQYTSASVSDNSGVNTWHNATGAHIGSSAGYQNYIWYAKNNDASNFTITVTFTGSVTFWNVYYVHADGGNPASDALDQATGTTWTTNASTQSTPSFTLLANDLIVTSIVCNSGTQVEFNPSSPTPPLSPISPGGSPTNSYANAYNNSVSSGSQSVTWTDSNISPCDNSSGHVGVVNAAAFKVGSATNGRGPQSWISKNEERPAQWRVAFVRVVWRREREGALNSLGAALPAS